MSPPKVRLRVRTAPLPERRKPACRSPSVRGVGLRPSLKTLSAFARGGRDHTGATVIDENNSISRCVVGDAHGRTSVCNRTGPEPARTSSRRHLLGGGIYEAR